MSKFKIGDFVVLKRNCHPDFKDKIGRLIQSESINYDFEMVFLSEVTLGNSWRGKVIVIDCTDGLEHANITKLEKLIYGL